MWGKKANEQHFKSFSNWSENLNHEVQMKVLVRGGDWVWEELKQSEKGKCILTTKGSPVFLLYFVDKEK